MRCYRQLLVQGDGQGQIPLQLMPYFLLGLCFSEAVLGELQRLLSARRLSLKQEAAVGSLKRTFYGGFRQNALNN